MHNYIISISVLCIFIYTCFYFLYSSNSVRISFEYRLFSLRYKYLSRGIESSIMEPTSIRFLPKRLGSRPTTSRLFHHPRKESSYMQYHVSPVSRCRFSLFANVRSWYTLVLDRKCFSSPYPFQLPFALSALEFAFVCLLCWLLEFWLFSSSRK